MCLDGEYLPTLETVMYRIGGKERPFIPYWNIIKNPPDCFKHVELQYQHLKSFISDVLLLGKFNMNQVKKTVYRAVYLQLAFVLSNSFYGDLQQINRNAKDYYGRRY